MQELFNPCAVRASFTTPLQPLWQLRLNDSESAMLETVIEDTEGTPSGYGGAHQMLGIADYVQGEIPFDFALEELGLKYEALQSEEEGSPLRREIAECASKWVLLLQIDSDDHTDAGYPGWMWSDAGILYFHIHERDLAACDFSKVRMTLQCH